MTIQSFDQVFQKISLSVGIKETFCDTEVKKLTIYKKDRSVDVKIVSPKLIPLQESEQLKTELQQALPGIKEVRLSLEYMLNEIDDEHFLSIYWENIKEYISQHANFDREDTFEKEIN